MNLNIKHQYNLAENRERDRPNQLSITYILENREIELRRAIGAFLSRREIIANYYKCFTLIVTAA